MWPQDYTPLGQDWKVHLEVLASYPHLKNHYIQKNLTTNQNLVASTVNTAPLFGVRGQDNAATDKKVLASGELLTIEDRWLIGGSIS
jgi:hypothetical protein